jgi:hypothetical protein
MKRKFLNILKTFKKNCIPKRKVEGKILHIEKKIKILEWQN